MYDTIDKINERLDELERAIFIEDMADTCNFGYMETLKREKRALEKLREEMKREA